MRKSYKNIIFCILKVTEKRSRSRIWIPKSEVTDPRIRIWICTKMSRILNIGQQWPLVSNGGVLLPDPEDVLEEDGVGVGVDVGVGVGGGVGHHHSPGGRVHGSADTAAPSTTVIVDKRLFVQSYNK
jgi:hypothetical protein